MIKINLDDKKISKIQEEHLKDFGVKKSVKFKRIKEVLNKLNHYTHFYKYFCEAGCLSDKIIRELLTVQGKQAIIDIIELIESRISLDARKLNKSEEEIKTEIEDHFNKLFINFSKRDWAIHFLDILEVNVCPYCNRIYTFTARRGSLKTKPELDHFFPKKQYPYMAISIFNIVPSCSLCNKGKSNKYVYVDKQGICYPYEEDFNDNIVFRTKSTTLDYLLDVSKDFSVELKGNTVFDDEVIENYNTAFKLNVLYNKHSDFVRQILEKIKIYNDDMINEILRNHPNLFSSEKEVVQMIFGNYLEIEDLSRRPLAKLTRDICNEFNYNF